MPKIPRIPKETHNSEAVISVGKYFSVKREDDVLKAKILETRVGENGSKEYYVHYESLNRRLDEWVPADRIISKGCEDEPSHNALSLNVGFRNIIEEDDLVDSESPTDDLEREHKQLTKVKHIDCIQFGSYEIDTWYFSPYPDEHGKQKKLFVCEYCLKYMKLEKTYRYHLGECTRRHPPGKEVYHKGTLSIYETDGSQSRLYCQNLCLLAKLFIDHKTIFFDIEQFLFYILCEVDKHGSHLVGYFSKEKGSPDGNNVACIVTLPPFQRQGYGKLLIAFSYELSKLEGVLGSPEHPLSDLGKLSYRSYWSWVLLDILRELKGNVTVRKLSEMTSITGSDIISTLESMNMLKYCIGSDAICVTPHLVDECIRSAQFKRPRLTVDTAHLKWEPPMKKQAVEPVAAPGADSGEESSERTVVVKLHSKLQKTANVNEAQSSIQDPRPGTSEGNGSANVADEKSNTTRREIEEKREESEQGKAAMTKEEPKRRTSEGHVTMKHEVSAPRQPQRKRQRKISKGRENRVQNFKNSRTKAGDSEEREGRNLRSTTEARKMYEMLVLRSRKISKLPDENLALL